MKLISISSVNIIINNITDLVRRKRLRDLDVSGSENFQEFNLTSPVRVV